MSRIRTDARLPTEVLVDALEHVEGASKVVILLEGEEHFIIKTNCTLQELHWLLAQGTHCALTDLFDVETKEGL